MNLAGLRVHHQAKALPREQAEHGGELAQDVVNTGGRNLSLSTFLSGRLLRDPLFGLSVFSGGLFRRLSFLTAIRSLFRRYSLLFVSSRSEMVVLPTHEKSGDKSNTAFAPYHSPTTRGIPVASQEAFFSAAVPT